MKSIITVTTILIGLLVATAGFPQEFNGEAVYPPEECNLVKTEMVCDPLVTKECKEMPVCYDSFVGEEDNYLEDETTADGGASTLTYACSLIWGIPDVENVVYIGAYYYLVLTPWPHYENSGLFAYCQNGVITICDTVTSNPLPVVMANLHDHAETTEIVRGCSPRKAIGPWSSLTHYQDTKLNIHGCEGPDELRGSPNEDRIVGGSDSDQIVGMGGFDAICGDYNSGGGYITACVDDECGFGDTGPSMADEIYGGEGVDQIWGLTGDDYIFGEGGADALYGGEDNDHIEGGEGDDIIYGGLGEDTIYGGRGCDGGFGGDNDDHIYLYKTDASTPDLCYYPNYNAAYGGEGDDEIRGAMDAENHMWGEGGDDMIYGNNGEDWICGGNGIYDRLHGGGGNDIVVDCLGVDEKLEDDEGVCDNEIYGEAGDSDIMCYYQVGTIDTYAQFCLDGGGGSYDLWYCDEPHAPGCQPMNCKDEVDSVSKCTHEGAFTCGCD